MMKTRFATVLVALSLGSVALVGCSNSATSETGSTDQSGATTQTEVEAGAWTQEMRDNFMNSCVGSAEGQEAFCECGLELMEEKYTADEMAEEEKKILAGDSSFFADIQEDLLARCGDKVK